MKTPSSYVTNTHSQISDGNNLGCARQLSEESEDKESTKLSFLSSSMRLKDLTNSVFSTVQRCFLVSFFHGGRLGNSDLVNHQTNTALGDDVRDRVTQLDEHHNVGSGDAQHGEDVDDRVGAPRDDSPPLDTLDEVTDGRVGFCVGGVSKSNKKSLDDVQERQHGANPVGPAGSKVVFAQDEFTRVSNGNHGSRGDSKRCGLGLDFIGGQLHDENNLDEEKWNGKEPIHVTVGVIEGIGSGRNSSGSIPFVGFGPRVEDSHVVVSCDESDQSRDDQSTLELLMNARLRCKRLCEEMAVEVVRLIRRKE